eukprot:1748282-Rhodomonas_salina.1
MDLNWRRGEGENVVGSAHAGPTVEVDQHVHVIAGHARRHRERKAIAEMEYQRPHVTCPRAPRTRFPGPYARGLVPACAASVLEGGEGVRRR